MPTNDMQPTWSGSGWWFQLIFQKQNLQTSAPAFISSIDLWNSTFNGIVEMFHHPTLGSYIPTDTGHLQVDGAFHAHLPWYILRSACILTTLKKIETGWWLSLPLWKLWVRQLGWWNSWTMEKHKTCSKPPTRKSRMRFQQSECDCSLLKFTSHSSSVPPWTMQMCLFLRRFIFCLGWGTFDKERSS